MALASHYVCPVSTYKRKLSPELQAAVAMVELCQQLSRSWQGCLDAHSRGRALQGAGVLNRALLVECLFFPS